MLFVTDTLGEGERQSITRFEAYLVENFDDSKEDEKQIDSFAFKNVSPKLKGYTDFHIVFYKKTNNTNVESIENYGKGLPPESLNDEIYDFWWSKGKFLVKYKLRNRKIINTNKNSEIKVESIKDPSLD